MAGVNNEIIEAQSEPKFRALWELLGCKFPRIDQMWSAMDFIWDCCECDNMSPDPKKLEIFYKHPVWVLNGLFIEQDIESLNNRREFAEQIKKLRPKRVADIGGGFGTLARMIAKKCPETQIEVLEPFAHQIALDRASNYSNLRYVSELRGEYDVFTAIDVFEHVLDPIKLVHENSRYLAIEGHWLVANCFYPVIKCHLPATFHFRRSWHAVMRSMGFETRQQVAYGQIYQKTSLPALAKARAIERRSRSWFPVIETIPRPLKGALSIALFGLDC